MNLLLLEPGETEIPRTDSRYRHITRILRLSSGDVIRAGEIDGEIGQATIVEIEPDRLRLRFSPERPPAPTAPVTLLLGHPRPIVLRRMLRDLTTVGIGAIVVVPTDTGERSYTEATLWNDTRTPMLEGAAQGSTTLLPQLVKAASLREAIERHLPDPATRIVLHGESDREGLVRRSLSSALGSTSPPIVVAVGSERGWSPSEIDFLTANGFQAASLGDRVLRTENAALVACWAACEACAERGRGGAGGSPRLGTP